MQLRGSFTIIVYVGLLLCVGVALGQNQDASPQNPLRQSHRQQGLLDYTLGKINPENRDIGAQFQSARTELVEESINNLYFWSNVFTLSLLFTAIALLFLERRAMWKKELIAATLLTELWNGRVSDRIEIEKRTQRYNELVDLHNAEIERGLLSKSEATSSAERAESKTQRGVNKLAEKPTPVIDAGRTPTVAPGSITAPQVPVETGSTSLQQKILLQQGQIEAIRNSEQNLKERLNQTTALLEQERKRNQPSKRV